MTDEFNSWLRRHASIPQHNPAPTHVYIANPKFYTLTVGPWGHKMDWTESQDRRPAANHVGFFSRGHYTEEMLVHCEDGTLLGKLVTNYMPVLRGTGVAAAGIEEAREDLIKRMSGGFQV